MDLSLTEAEQDLADLCRDFAQKEIAPRAPKAARRGRDSYEVRLSDLNPYPRSPLPARLWNCRINRRQSL